MTSIEFVTWLRGFAAAANNFTLTPAQWDEVKDMLNKVNPTEEWSTLSRYTLDKNYYTNNTAQIKIKDDE